MSDEGKLKKRLITEAGRYAVHGKTSDVVVKWEHIEKVLAEKAKNFPDPGELRFKRALNTPHQYHPSTIIKCLLEISKGDKSREHGKTIIKHAKAQYIKEDWIRCIGPPFQRNILRLISLQSNQLQLLSGERNQL